MKRICGMVRCGWLALLLALAACGGGGSGGAPAPVAGPARDELVSVPSTESIDSATVNAAIAALVSSGVDTSRLSGAYRLSLNRIVYKTVTPDGRLIDASGVVAYPLKLNGVRSPLLSYQHWTALQNSEAPSVSPNIDPVLIALAGSGFIVAMPDYIGYGAATRDVHPYVQAQGLAASVVDMLRAARRLLANNNVVTNGQLFLTGYSEGGYATLAAQKEMEQNLAGEFPITASMPAAGPYDMTATAQNIVGLAVNPDPELVAFVFKAYDYWYGWNRLSEIFQPPYDAVIAAYLYDGNYIQGPLTTDSAALFNATFRTAFLGGGEATVKAAVAANNIHDWRPSAPTRLFHGPEDSVVPYFNATNALAAMTAAGSTSVTIADCTTPALIPRGHSECIPSYLSQVIGWFVPLAADL